MSQNDDQNVGHLLNRREALAYLGIVSAAMLASCAPGQTTTEPSNAAPTQSGANASPQPTAAGGVSTLPTCIARPEMTEGPYFVDEKLNRTDIRSDPASGAVSDGAPLQLAFRVSRIDGAACTPLAGALVDIWHCDAEGVYSDVRDSGGRFDTTGQQFLRGYQVTDASGGAQFLTIYPGWYQGRATHIHFKIRNDPAAQPGFDFTSQLFFDDAQNDQVYTQPPYAAKGPNTMRNAQDGIFSNGGDQLVLNVTPQADGYAAIFDIGLQMS